MFGKKKAEGDKDKKDDEVELTEAKASSEQASVGEMKRGDYRIHIYVEKAKDLKVPEDSTIDPLVEISCLNLKQYSTVKEKIGGIGETVWNEHLFLEPMNVEKQSADEAKISLKILDKGYLKNTQIGQFEFDMSFIYFKKDHALLHQWVAISDPNSENYSEITGYLKISINVCCQGDEPIQINDDDNTDDSNIIMPPSLNPKFHQIKIRFFQAQDLAMMDIGIALLGKKSKTDAYFTTTYKKKQLKTQVKVFEEGKKAIDINEEIWVPAQVPITQKKLIVKLMDYDIDGDETIGSLQFDMKDIIEGSKNNCFMWKNIYGSPISTSIISGQNKTYKKIMDENPELASSWKGRILMQIECFQTEKPEAKVQKIDQETINDSYKHKEDKKYQIIAEIGQGVALPESKKYHVKMIIGGKELTTESAAYQKSNYNRFNKRFDQQSLVLPYINIEDIGNIILVLMDEDKPICFYKESIINFMKEDAEYKWIQLLPDRCINQVKDNNQAGLISFKLSISNQKNIDFKTFKAWKKLPSKRANPVLVRAYIFQCRDLPAADDDGSSDPYVKLWDLSGKDKKTRVIYDNVNPLFFQVIELEYEIRDEMDDLYSYPPFIIDVFDHDDELFDSTPDYLGRAIIEPEDCQISLQSQFEKNKKLEIPSKPRWHPLKFAEGEPVCGQILISFSVSSLEYNYQYQVDKVDLRSRVEFKEFDVSMLILGLRQLQSPGILPVKKAYINFNVKSLVPAENTAIQNIQTQPQALGPNPTINTTIEFSIPLPTDQLYCPRMSCMVYDNIYLGFSQPQIGVFTIPIGDIMFDLKRERKEELQAIELIIRELDKIINAGPELNVKNYSQNKMINTDINNSESFKSKRKKSANKVNKSGGSDTQYDVSIEDEDSGLIQKDQSESAISDSMKARKKSSGRKKSASSISESEQIKKSKKKQEKLIKGSINESDMKEQFGANQRDGEEFADDLIQQQLNGIQKRKESIKQTGLFPNQIEESKGNQDFQRKNSLAKFSVRKGSVNQKNSLSKYDTLKILKEDKEQEKRINEDKRKQAEEERHALGEYTQMIILPQYELDKRLKVFREVNHPSQSLYEGLGWDEDRSNPTKHVKHYRYFHNDELENIKEIFPKQSPFNSYEINKGQDRGISKSFFNLFQKIKKDASGQDSTKKKVGTFKGIVEVESKEDKKNYKNSKNILIERLKEQIDIISQQKTGKEYNNLDLDGEKLFSPIERKKTELKFREFGIDHLYITKHLADLESENILKRMLMKKTKCLVRFYAISADHLSSRDIGSDSDPYLFLTCNDKTYNERNNYQLDNPNPKFHKFYDFEGTFPGCSPLQIDIFDYDDIFGDDLIGTTSIDLEDRYFSLEWQNLNEKPIEVRQIYIQSSQIDQGTIKCWVEINDLDTPREDQVKEWDISEKPAEEFEIRICVFNCKDVKMMDFEGTSDVFCRGFFDSKEDVQETDTHYRNQDGKPDFQYRLVYKIQYPRKNNDYKFTLQMYDRDFFKSNDMIGSAQIDLKNLIEDSSLTKQSLCLNESYYKDVLGSKFPSKLAFDSTDKSRFWLDMKSKNKEKNKLEVNGQVKLQIDVLPYGLAEKNKVGKARDQPNHSPQLPQPEGRLELSINPFKMFNQMVGPALRAKIYCILCITLACILFLAILPNILGSIAAAGFNKVIGL